MYIYILSMGPKITWLEASAGFSASSCFAVVRRDRVERAIYLANAQIQSSSSSLIIYTSSSTIPFLPPKKKKTNNQSTPEERGKSSSISPLSVAPPQHRRIAANHLESSETVNTHLRAHLVTSNGSTE